MNLVLSALGRPGTADRPVEVAERKGLGHPDTICDALGEDLSVSLSRHYLEHEGRILHHNVDKVLLRAGRARAGFGGGEVLEPIEIYLAGRATAVAGGADVPIEALAVEGSRAWLGRNLHALDPERHVRIHCLVRPGSSELTELFSRPSAGPPLANDTSCGAGYAPLSDLERAVLAVERALASGVAPGLRGERGEDVKVMGVRQGERIRLTVACALIGRYLPGAVQYAEKKALAAERAREAAAEVVKLPVEVEVNAADDPVKGSVYLTVTGTSAEAGDDGVLGRGNRVNGLISPGRPLSLEAAAGKNAVTHVGKLYNLAAHRLAQAVVERLKEVAEAHCFLVSRIGRPITEPEVVDVRLLTRDAIAPASLRRPVEELVAAELAGLPGIWEDLVRGRVALW